MAAAERGELLILDEPVASLDPIARRAFLHDRLEPGHRYWPFQWIETAAYTFLAALLAAFGLWWVRRRITLR